MKYYIICGIIDKIKLKDEFRERLQAGASAFIVANKIFSSHFFIDGLPKAAPAKLTAKIMIRQTEL